MLTYVCEMGDLAEGALLGEGAFVVTDTQGRNWYCHEQKEEPKFEDLAFDMLKAQLSAQKQGFAKQGNIRVTHRTEKNKLPSLLAKA